MASSVVSSGGVGNVVSIVEWLQSLGDEMLSDLFEDRYTCVTIFRSLPPVAKQYVMRMLFSSIESSWVVLDSFYRRECEEQHKETIDRLLKLGIWKIEKVKLGTSEASFIVRQHASFRRSIITALSSEVASEDIMQQDTDSSVIRIDAHGLDKHAHSCWNAILHWMVGCIRANTAACSDTVQALLVDVKLMTRKHAITPRGFHFLFQSTHAQVWTFVSGYVDSLRSRRNQRQQVITFLFRMPFLKPGMAYSTSPLTKIQRELLCKLHALGLLYLRDDERFYSPTRLAVNLSPATPQSAVQRKEGFIIVETTFKVYAFTSSALKIKMLDMIIRIDYRLPKLIIGKITKYSLLGALKHGLSSQEVIDFLELYAHPKMIHPGRPGGVLPSNVRKQVELWEQEHSRFSLQSGVFIGSFTDKTIFTQLLEFGRKERLIEHVDEKRMWIFVSKDGFPPLQEFRKQQQEDQRLELERQMAREARIRNVELGIDDDDIDDDDDDDDDDDVSRW